jgi:hypothetical protein
MTFTDGAGAGRSKPRPWVAKTGERVATVAVNELAFVLTIDKTVARGILKKQTR